MKMVRNAIGRLVPESVEGLGTFSPFMGVWAKAHASYPSKAPAFKLWPPRQSKIAQDLKQAIEASGLENGGTISFHHHLRNGDAVLPLVLRTLAEMGYRDLTIAPSSLTDAHECVAEYIRTGLIRRIYTSGLRGEVGKAISRGELEIPVVVRSHGGRARSIEEGSTQIDVAFLAAPTCDAMGNMTGCMGPSGCGALGYAMLDARYAKHVIALTDNLVDFPLKMHVSVPQYLVDQVVVIDSLGDPQKIASGSTRITRNPVDLKIAHDAFRLLVASEILAPGCSLQLGAGGASLAVASYVREYMKEKGIVGSFSLGGITGYIAQMLQEGLFQALFDVQSFDPSVKELLLHNPNYIEIDQSWYASPINKGALVNNLDAVILAALDVDVDFNVNVLTGNDGILRGASGGHCDTAAGAKLTIVVAPSFRRGVPTIKDRVQTVVTPSESIDAIVTERGICINPRRADLLEAARSARLPVKDIHDLKAEIERLTGVPKPAELDTDRVVALVEYRDGTLIDSVYRIRK